MKKFTGWVTIILCSFFLMIFLLALLIILIRPNPEAQITTKEVIFSSIAFVAVVILLILGLMNGLKKIKKEKVQIIDYTDTLNINLTGKISYKDYRNFVLKSIFKRWWIYVLCSFVVLFVPNIVKPNPVIFVIVFVIFLFVYLLIWTKKIYKTNKVFHGQNNYKLTNETLQITGETFDSTNKWTSFYKFKETKTFFIFYHDNAVANFIDKKMFAYDELAAFKQFICSLNLKR